MFAHGKKKAVGKEQEGIGLAMKLLEETTTVMDDLIATLVKPRQQAHAQLLLDDPGSRNLIRQQLSQLADDNAGLIPQKSFSWILCKLSTFGAEESDTFRIYQAFLSQLNQLEQMCRLLSGENGNCKHDPPAAVANRITVGLGLFYEHAARRHQYHAAPSPQFYQQVATTCFAVTGYKTIATQLPEWLEFLRASFTLPKP
jgi:hypothetical protein